VRILVTGAQGFSGRHFQQSVPSIPLEASVDLRDPKAIDRALAGQSFDAVLHLAAQSSIAASLKDPWRTMETNFVGTLNLLVALTRNAFRGKFLFVSSGDVYGGVAPDALPIQDDSPLCPQNPYSLSKAAAEALCLRWSQRESFSVVVARPFNLLGPGQDDRFGIANFAKQVVLIKLGRQAPLIEVGDLDVTRDFIDVRDANRAYQALLDRGADGQSYNICSGRELRLRGLLERMLSLAAVSAKIQTAPDRVRAGEQRRMAGSAKKIFDLCQWRPQVDLDTSLQDVMADWERRLSG